jgi:hypothetical protein
MVAPTKGTYTGQLQNRSYTFELAGVKEIGVVVDVREISKMSESNNNKELYKWERSHNQEIMGIRRESGNKKSKPEARFNKTTGIYTIEVGSRSIREPLVLELTF